MTAVPAFFGFCLLPLCPREPAVPFPEVGRRGARAAFLKLTKHGNVDDFLEEMRAEMASKADKDQFRFLDLFTKKELRLAFAIACVAQATQQFSGVIAVSLTKNRGTRDPEFKCYEHDLQELAGDAIKLSLMRKEFG